MNEASRGRRTDNLIASGLFDVDSTTRQVPQSSAVVVVVHDQVQQAWPETTVASSPSPSTSHVLESNPDPPSTTSGENTNDNTNRYSTGMF